MASGYNTPEQALKAAEDSIKLDRNQNAYDILFNFMTNRRFKQWSQPLEKIMTLLIDLSLKLNKYSQIRDALNSYKYATQHSNIAGLEIILNYYSKSAEEIFEETAKKINMQVLDIEDLENEEFEELMLGSINPQAGTERDTIRHAWRVLWESYKVILDISSKNKKLEDLYVTVANRAFEFCKQHKRRVEFKRVCDQIRNHLRQIKYTMENNPDFMKIPFVLDLANAETNEKQLSVRFSQLQYCYHFELWQEALKTLEDLNNIMQKKGHSIKPKHLAEYFENLATMFWKSEFYLYHAIAFFHHYSLYTTKQRSITPEEIRQKSSLLVLSVLAIPPLQLEQFQTDDARTKTVGLLTSDESVLSRNELLAYIQRQNILDLVHPDVKDLFRLIQDQEDVFSLAKQGEALIQRLKGTAAFEIYVAPVQSVVIYKLLRKLSQIYRTLKIDRFVQLIGTFDFDLCEHIINLANSTDYINVKIDHLRKLIVFSDRKQDLQQLSIGISTLSEEVKEIADLIDEQRENATYLKNLEHFRNDAQVYIEGASEALTRRLDLINSLKSAPVGRDTHQRRPEEDKNIQQQQAREQERVEQEKRQQKVKDDKVQEVQKKREELNVTKKLNLLKELQQYKGLKIKGKKIEDLAQQDIDSLKVDDLERAREAHIKEEKENEERQNKKVFSRYDYIERARREEQVAVLQHIWDAAKLEKEEILKVDRATFDRKIEIKTKLALALPLKQAKAEAVLKERKEKAEKAFEEYKARIQQKERDGLLTKAQEYLKEAIEQEALERKRREEDEKKKKEEEARKARERFEDKGEVKSEGLFRNTRTRAELEADAKTKEVPQQQQSDSKFFRKAGDKAGEKPSEEPKKPSFGITRSEKPREEVKAPERKETKQEEKPSTGFTRGPARNIGGPTEAPKETKPVETTGKFSTGGDGPKRFTNAKKDGGSAPVITRSTAEKKEEKPTPEEWTSVKK